MKLAIVAGGKVREAYLRQAIDEYVKRTRRFLPIEEIEVRPGKDKRAAEAMLRAVPKRHELWALDVGGSEPTSHELARWVEDRMDHGSPGICFVIGGAEGLPPQVRDRASRRLSLSRMTLPHRLARLLLAEQLYRALTIIRGTPYSK